MKQLWLDVNFHFVSSKDVYKIVSQSLASLKRQPTLQWSFNPQMSIVFPQIDDLGKIIVKYYLEEYEE